jgi:hypothetical protein
MTCGTSAQQVWYVDDDAPNDPAPGDNSISDPLEDGTSDHPFDAIQEAIDAALQGDEVIVAAGVYRDNIDFLGKAITLGSADGPETTIIESASYGGTPVVQCVSGEGPDTVLIGFTVTGGDLYQLYSGCGGGMYNSYSSPTVVDCIFTSNRALFGGGMCNQNSDVPVSNCRFVRNVAYVTYVSAGIYVGGDGGGIYQGGGHSVVRDSLFLSNQAVDDIIGGGAKGTSAQGGAIFGGVDVLGCSFVGNSVRCQDSAAIGGAVSGPINVVNCAFSLNTAKGWNRPSAAYGGALADVQRVVNCTFTLNAADAWSAWAGGLMGAGEIINCVVWGNDPPGITNVSTVIHSNVQGGWSGPGWGNVDADPLFTSLPPDDGGDGFGDNPYTPDIDEGANDDLGDLRLLPGSPCIDAGINSAIADLASTDLDGSPRFADDPATADTGCGVPVVVDMGAYEFQGQPAEVFYADLTGDGIIGLDDFDTLLNCWSSSDDPCCLADLDLDGTVGVLDFLILLANWG